MTCSRFGVKNRLAALAVLLVTVPTALILAESPEKSNSPRGFRSGLQHGEDVPFFYSRVVTGSLMNKSVCFVCRNGNRPVVMLLMRQLKPEFANLMRTVDKLVDGNRAVGLKSFGVLISDEPFRDSSAVQTFAFDSKVKMPLTVGTDAIANNTCQRLHEDAELTVVLYRNRSVVKNYSFRMSQLKDADVAAIAKSIHRLIDTQ